MESAGTASSTAEALGGSADYLNVGMFGSSSQQQQQHAGDVLVGNAFGSALGNGFGNNDVTAPASVGGVPASSSNTTSTTVATTNTGTSFDLSDFPSLGGGGGSAGFAVVGGGGAAATSSVNSSGGNGLAAALRQQQLLAHQQQQQMLQAGAGASSKGVTSTVAGSAIYRMAMTGGNGNFNMATEDFPALSSVGVPAPPNSASNATAVGASGVGGAGNGPLSAAASSLLTSGNSASVPSISRTPSNGGTSGLYGGEVESGTTSAHLEGGAAGLLGGAGLTGLGGLRVLQQQQSQSSVPNPTTSQPSSSGPSGRVSTGGAGAIGTAPPASAAAVVGTALQGDYGLLGLLGVIRMTDADRNALALGSDLTLLGLNLGSADHIYSTFSSPWLSADASQPTKDPHYQLPSCYYMQPPALKTGHLSKFQLETLFYIFYALPKDVLQAYAAQELYSREWRYNGELKLWFKRAGPSDGVALTTSTGSPQYLYFDINTWERRLFNGNMTQNIISGFLPEEDVRVKFPNS